MQEKIVKKSNIKNHIHTETFENVPQSLEEITSDYKIYYMNDKGEKIFLAKYIQNVLRDPIVEEQLVHFIKDKEYGTYDYKHNDHTTRMFDKIYELSIDILHEFNHSIEKTEVFHFFYNKQMLIHRDLKYKQLRSLNVIKGSDVICYFVFSDFNIYINMEQGDLLLFDASQYHYMQRTKNKSETNYRLAINMI